MKNLINTPILVTGIERSGSTLIAKIIQICGGFTGETTKMCENIRIKRLVDDYYNVFNYDPRGQWPLPDPDNLLIPKNWKDEIFHSLNMDHYTSDLLWMYKSTRIAQTWPIWNNAFPEAKWILVRRRTGDVIKSCISTGFMSAYKDPNLLKLINADTERDGWLWWVHEQEKTLVEMLNANLNIKILWPERMMDGNFDQIHEILDWLELPWKPEILTLLHSKLLKDLDNGK